MSPGRHRSRPVQTASEKIGPDEDLNLKSSIGQSGLDCAIESASRDWWYQGAMVAVQQLARSGRGFDVDHVASLTGEPPAAVYWGALFAAATKLGVVEAVGCRVAGDGRLVRVYWGSPDAR